MKNIKTLNKRIKKAEGYFVNPDIPSEEKERFIPSYRRLIQELAILSSIYYSEKLKQKFWFNDKGELCTEDGLKYSIEEQQQLLDYDNNNIASIHALKKTFNGRVMTADELMSAGSHQLKL